MEKPVILCGLGQVGWRVLGYLQTAGVTVVAIDNRCLPDDPRLQGGRLIRADYRQREVLEMAGVNTAGGVLILSSDDLTNISTVLMVRHLNPDVRVVVRLFNQNIIQRLGKAVTNVFALSVSQLTAPLIALTALTGRPLGTFGPEDDPREIIELVIHEQSSLRGQKIGALNARHGTLVIAHGTPPAEDRLLLDIDPETLMAAGDRVIVCARPNEVATLQALVEGDALQHLRWAGWLNRMGRIVWRTLVEVDVAVKVCTAVLIVAIATSTLVYHLGMHRSVTDGVYRTISVMATGSDMREQELTVGWQKLFVSVLRILGATLIAAFTALVTNYLLRARLGGALEIRRIPDGGHVIVCGLGHVGFRVVESLLQHGERVVAIEQALDSRLLTTTRRLGVAVIVADATVLEVLRQAHAATARAVVATTDNELANLEIALLARELNPTQRVVVRLADPQLAQTARDAANIRFALSIPGLAAPAFVAAIFGDRIQSVFLVGSRLLAVLEVVVDEDEPHLQGQFVRALATDYRFLPVSLLGADRVRLEPMDHQLTAGDHLTVIACLTALERLLRRERPPADWAVELTALPPAARDAVVQVVRQRRRPGAELADGALEALPARLATHLTRGQAEDLLLQVGRQGAVAQLRHLDGQA